MTQKNHKPVIETIVNSAALALFAFGVTAVTTGNWKGYIAMAFGMVIEFFKYWGRKNKYW
jgi:hypothetical protein